MLVCKKGIGVFFFKYSSWSHKFDATLVITATLSLVQWPHLTFSYQCSRFTHMNIIIAKIRKVTLKTLQKSSSPTLQLGGTSDALSVSRYLLLEEPNERCFQCWSCLDLILKLWNISKCVYASDLSQQICSKNPTFTTREKYFSSFLTINSTFTLFRIRPK